MILRISSTLSWTRGDALVLQGSCTAQCCVNLLLMLGNLDKGMACGCRRNELVSLDLVMTIVACALGLVAAVAGICGMCVQELSTFDIHVLSPDD